MLTAHLKPLDPAPPFLTIETKENLTKEKNMRVSVVGYAPVGREIQTSV